MELRRHIQAALEATRLLEEALRAGNLMSCTALLDQREHALNTFSEAHGRATPGDRDACRVMLEELVAADEDLQVLGRDHLKEAAEDLHRSTPRPSENRTLSGCFDRKA